jgi:glycosyltransferase involved in cell wall biosynthesis
VKGEKNIRLLFIAHSFYRGGAEKCLFDIVQYSADEGFKCLVLGPKNGPYLDDFRRIGVSVKSFTFGSLLSEGKRSANIKRLLRIGLNTLQVLVEILQFRPDLIYTNTSVIISGALAARLARIPHIWHIHENFQTFGREYIISLETMRRAIRKLSSTAIFVTKLSLESLFSDNGPGNAVVIHNGIQLMNESRDLIPYLARKRDTNPPKVFFAGSLTHQKGLDILLRAVEMVCYSGNLLHLDIWGDGQKEYVQFLKDLCTALNISDFVHFKGYGENLRSILPNYCVAVVPSRGESFSLVVLEAMAAGVPVIASRCGGPEEFVEDGRTGWLVEREDAINLSATLMKVLTNPERASIIAEKARQMVSKRFRLESQLSSIISIIRTTVNEGKFP